MESAQFLPTAQRDEDPVLQDACELVNKDVKWGNFDLSQEKAFLSPIFQFAINMCRDGIARRIRCSFAWPGVVYLREFWHASRFLHLSTGCLHAFIVSRPVLEPVESAANRRLACLLKSLMGTSSSAPNVPSNLGCLSQLMRLPAGGRESSHSSDYSPDDPKLAYSFIPHGNVYPRESIFGADTEIKVPRMFSW